MVSTDPNDPNFGLETDQTSPNFGLPAEHKEEGGVVSGILSGLGHALNPVTLVKGALNLGEPSDISKIYHYGKSLTDIVGGKPVEESLRENIPEIAQAREAAFGQQGTKAQAEYWTGAGLQAALLGVPFVHGKIRTLRETAFGERPEATPQIPEPLATDIAKQQTETIPAQPVEEVIPNAVQEQGPSSVLPHPQEAVGEAGGERVGVGQGIQGEEIAQARPETQTVAKPSIHELLNRYDEGDPKIQTVRDLVDELDAQHGDNPKVAAAVEKYRADQEENMQEFGGRGDEDQIESDFLSAVKEVAAPVPQPEQPSLKTPEGGEQLSQVGRPEEGAVPEAVAPTTAEPKFNIRGDQIGVGDTVRYGTIGGTGEAKVLSVEPYESTVSYKTQHRVTVENPDGTTSTLEPAEHYGISLSEKPPSLTPEGGEQIQSVGKPKPTEAEQLSQVGRPEEGAVPEAVAPTTAAPEWKISGRTGKMATSWETEGASINVEARKRGAGTGGKRYVATVGDEQYGALTLESAQEWANAKLSERASPQTPAVIEPTTAQPLPQTEVVPPPVETPPTPEVPVQKPSKIGQSIEAKAVEAKLTEGFSETAGYDPITIKDQAERATSFVKSSPDAARAVVRGESPLPEGLRGTSLITAMEEQLLKKPDAQLAYELANSPLTSATSAAAQEMRLMSERVPDSLSAKFNEIRRAREAGSKLRGETPESVFQDIKKEIVRQSSKRPRWEEFVRSIEC